MSIRIEHFQAFSCLLGGRIITYKKFSVSESWGFRFVSDNYGVSKSCSVSSVNVHSIFLEDENQH